MKKQTRKNLSKAENFFPQKEGLGEEKNSSIGAIKGVSRELRKKVLLAARDAGMSVEEWLTQFLGATAEERLLSDEEKPLSLREGEDVSEGKQETTTVPQPAHFSHSSESLEGKDLFPLLNDPSFLFSIPVTHALGETSAGYRAGPPPFFNGTLLSAQGASHLSQQDKEFGLIFREAVPSTRDTDVHARLTSLTEALEELDHRLQSISFLTAQNQRESSLQPNPAQNFPEGILLPASSSSVTAPSVSEEADPSLHLGGDSYQVSEQMVEKKLEKGDLQEERCLSLAPESNGAPSEVVGSALAVPAASSEKHTCPSSPSLELLFKTLQNWFEKIEARLDHNKLQFSPSPSVLSNSAVSNSEREERLLQSLDTVQILLHGIAQRLVVLEPTVTELHLLHTRLSGMETRLCEAPRRTDLFEQVEELGAFIREQIPALGTRLDDLLKSTASGALSQHAQCRQAQGQEEESAVTQQTPPSLPSENLGNSGNAPRGTQEMEDFPIVYPIREIQEAQRSLREEIAMHSPAPFVSDTPDTPERDLVIQQRLRRVECNLEEITRHLGSMEKRLFQVGSPSEEVSKENSKEQALLKEKSSEWASPPSFLSSRISRSEEEERKDERKVSPSGFDQNKKALNALQVDLEALVRSLSRDEVGPEEFEEAFEKHVEKPRRSQGSSGMFPVEGVSPSPAPSPSVSGWVRKADFIAAARQSAALPSRSAVLSTHSAHSLQNAAEAFADSFSSACHRGEKAGMQSHRVLPAKTSSLLGSVVCLIQRLFTKPAPKKESATAFSSSPSSSKEMRESSRNTLKTSRENTMPSFPLPPTMAARSFLKRKI